MQRLLVREVIRSAAARNPVAVAVAHDGRELTYAEVSGRLRESSVVCLPIGAIEQHGPHLPLNTDLIIAEALLARLIARWGEECDLWQLPAIPVSLSREHDWAAGTLSLTLQTFVALMRNLAGEIVRATPARNLLIFNAHGGNRGVLALITGIASVRAEATLAGVLADLGNR